MNQYKNFIYQFSLPYISKLLCAFILCQKTGAQTMVIDGRVTYCYETSVYLQRGQTVIFDTKNLSEGSDPVLHLFSAGRIEMAADDNSGGGNSARLRYTPPVSAHFILLVRSRSNTSGGTADVYKNGSVLAESVAFGGWQFTINNLRKNETLHTVKLPNGAEGTHCIYLLKGGRVGIAAAGFGGGAGKAAILKSAFESDTRGVLITTTGKKETTRFIRNDALLSGHDPDHDGLGTELERGIGTCSGLSGYAKSFDCSLATDPRDTDGDGISDGYEVLGKNDVTPHQPLPKWGANPRHKDMFIEVDFMRRSGEENASNTIKKMPPTVARHMSEIYSDINTTSDFFKLYHARVLKNPDDIPGIAVHLDTGEPPQSPEDATIYGDWGGFNAVNSVKSDGKPCTSANQNCRGVAADKDNNAWKDEAWKDNMSKARRGIFRYALGYDSGGGQCGPTFACAFNFFDNSNVPHEWGHTLGLGHSGPYNATGAIDPNCKPNYASIMNYAFIFEPKAGFADGEGVPQLNNARLKEWKAAPISSTLFLDVLEKEFGYWVDRANGHVDWNRDGIFSQEGTMVRAYANYKPGSACEYTRYNQMEVPGTKSQQTPVLGRLGNRLYLFYIENGTLKYRYSNSTWNCPEPGVNGCAGGSWTSVKEAGFPTLTGVDVRAFGSTLFVVGIKWNSEIVERRLSLNGQIENWTEIFQIPGRATGEPTLSLGSNGVYLAYKGQDNLIHFRRYRNTWGEDRTAQMPGGQSIVTTSGTAYPALFTAELSYNNNRSLYGLFPGADARLDLYFYNLETNFWEKTNLFENGSRPGPVRGRPSTAYVPFPSGYGMPGRLYIGYITQGGSPSDFEGTARMLMSYVKVTVGSGGALSKRETIGLNSYFDNSWYKAYSMSLFYEPDRDQNVKAAISVAGGDHPFRIMFRPKADGINDFSYRNYNDWDILRVKVCKQVVNPGGSVSNPIKCPER